MTIKKFDINWDEFDDEENQKFEPVMSRENTTTFVSDADMIHFIERNSNMNWNQVCDYVIKYGITSETGIIYWDSDDLDDENLNKEQSKWIKGFFKAHPWIKRMMIVFDD